MSASDWYRQRLGPARPAQPAAAPRVVLGQDGRAQLVYPEQTPSPEQYLSRPWEQQQLRPGEAPLGQTTAGDGIRLWRGSREAQGTSDRCPECGSGNYIEQITAKLGEGQGGESGKRSAGFCMGCGYRPGGRNIGPSLQPHGSIRGMNQGEIPVESARQAATPRELQWTGRPGIVQRISAL